MRLRARISGRPKDSRKFDIVCYGLLDSHAMFSSMSSLRLDNFVYQEGLQDAWAHVADDGVLSVSFSVASEWMYRRLLALVRNATGVEPIVVEHGYDYGVTFLAGKTLTLAHVRTMYPEAKKGEADVPSIRMPTDDWPFLYLRPGTVPWTYIAVFLLIAVWRHRAEGVFGKSLFSRGRFDPQMFLLGAAFLLLETRAVTAEPALPGSTWVVNTSVFAGVTRDGAGGQPARRASFHLQDATLVRPAARYLIGLWLLPTRADRVAPGRPRRAGAGWPSRSRSSSPGSSSLPS